MGFLSMQDDQKNFFQQRRMHGCTSNVGPPVKETYLNQQAVYRASVSFALATEAKLPRSAIVPTLQLSLLSANIQRRMLLPPAIDKQCSHTICG